MHIVIGYMQNHISHDFRVCHAGAPETLRSRRTQRFGSSRSFRGSPHGKGRTLYAEMIFFCQSTGAGVAAPRSTVGRSGRLRVPGAPRMFRVSSRLAAPGTVPGVFAPPQHRGCFGCCRAMRRRGSFRAALYIAIPWVISGVVGPRGNGVVPGVFVHCNTGCRSGHRRAPAAPGG